MNVTCNIKPYEINGEERKAGDGRELIISSHWNRSDRLHLRFGDLDMVVSVADLQRAIANAANH